MAARILVVDDDETVLSVMTDMLSCIGGYDVVPRSNGAGLFPFTSSLRYLSRSGR